MKLNDYLKYERKKQKLTLIQLAKKAAISYGMLYRLEEGAIKHPKPILLKQVAAALQINYEALLLKYGYMMPANQENKSIVIKEKAVLLARDFINNSNKAIGTIRCMSNEQVDYVIRCDDNTLMPLAKKDDFLGLKKTKDYKDSTLYVRKETNSKLSLYIAKQYADEVVLVNYPDLYRDVKKVNNTPFYKIVFRHSDETCFTKEKVD